VATEAGLIGSAPRRGGPVRGALLEELEHLGLAGVRRSAPWILRLSLVAPSSPTSCARIEALLACPIGNEHCRSTGSRRPLVCSAGSRQVPRPC
jgi:hypothetical protein